MNEDAYEQAVVTFYEGLYAFAYSLAGNADDACELTQETFYRLLAKGRQVRDPSKVKAWLFTTLYRVFLGWKRHENRFPHLEICAVEGQVPPLTPDMADEADAETVMETVLNMEQHYRAPLVLYYLQGLSYREIAEVLDVPIGTVMSRLSRAKELVRERLAARLASKTVAAVSLDGVRSKPSP